MIAKNKKKILLFDSFLSSLAEEPLRIKYKYVAKILFISESTLSKLRHQKLNRIPDSLLPENVSNNFAHGIVNFFTYSENTVRLFSIYAQKILESYICSDTLIKMAISLVDNPSIDINNIKTLCSRNIPAFLKRCYEESYSNSVFNCNKRISNRGNVQSEIYFKKICDIINRDTFDSDKLRKLLNIIYAANIKHQISKYMMGGRTLLDMTGSFLEIQSQEPFFNYVHRNEVVSITPDSRRITRTVKGRQQIVFQTAEPQEYVLYHPFNHFINKPTDEIVKKAFICLRCTINNIPIVKYINMHENTNYTDIRQLLFARQVKDNITGTVETELTFRFNFYPNTVGETADINYEYCYITPFIPNISCNYSFSLLYPCKYLEHEFALDSITKAQWGIQVKLFTPITTSVCTSKPTDDLTAKSGGTTDLKRITFYNWALPGTGYLCNLYELKYKDGKV